MSKHHRFCTGPLQHDPSPLGPGKPTAKTLEAEKNTISLMDGKMVISTSIFPWVP